MPKGLVLKETMSGWLQWDNDNRRQDFAFSIRAFTARLFSLSAPRYFKGTVTLDGQSFSCHGELTLQLSGPHYWLRFQHPEHGLLHVEGRKRYGRNGLLASLVTCPLTVYQGRQAVARAEVAYRDSKLAFPFKALRLVDESRAYGD